MLTALTTTFPARLRGTIVLLLTGVIALLAITGSAHALPLQTKLHLPARADLRYGGYQDPFGRWIVQIPLGQNYVQAFQDARGSRPGTGNTITKYEFARGDYNNTNFVDNGAQGWRYRNYYAFQIGQQINAAVRITDSGGQQDTKVVPFWLAYTPQASLLPSSRYATPGEPIVFDASGSRTRAPGIDHYEWSFDGGATFPQRSTNPRLTRKVGQSGYTCVIVRAVGSDFGRDTAGSCVKIHDAPKASFNATPAKPRPGDQVLLDASNSSDDEGIALYEWDTNGDGSYDTSSTDPTTTVKFAKAGKVDVHLRVTDGFGAKTVATKTIEVGNPTGGAAKHMLAMGIARGTLKVKSGKVALRVSCPGTAKGGCDGTARLRLGGRQIAAASFAIRRGHSATLGMKLTSAARKALKKRSPLSATALATAVDDGGNPAAATVRLKIRR